MTDHLVQDNPDRKYEVTPLELFFDLVFAFAISQISSHLLRKRKGEDSYCLISYFLIHNSYLSKGGAT